MHVLRTRSLFALSLITVVFEDGSDGYFTRERLQERLASVNLPYEAKPGLDPYTSPTGEIYRYTLESKSRSLRELSELQFWTVIPRLQQVRGVADVSNFGGLTTQFMLELDPAKLDSYGSRWRRSRKPSTPTTPAAAAASSTAASSRTWCAAWACCTRSMTWATSSSAARTACPCW
jgi:Cu/Ag efflux pump CusA